ncbi:MAG: hypothetical protein FWD35_04500 [Oscillospiraceae bacterium]|nr:hypothetical protein [Oscillospiraceae bacterium]
MKLRKLLAILVAAVMVSALAITSSASPILTVDIVGNCPENGGTTNPTRPELEAGRWGVQTHVAGQSVNTAKTGIKGIDPWLITGIRVTFSNVKWHVAEADETANNIKAGDEVARVGVAFNTTASDFNTRDFTLRKDNPASLTVTRNFSHDPQENGFLEVSIALWIKDTAARARIEILGPNGVVLADGTTEESLNSGSGSGTATTAGGTGSGSGTTRRPASQTSVGGIAIVGGIAVLAAGGAIVSRKRKV